MAIEKGYIKLYRSMLDWEWYKDTNVKVVFLHCLLKANYKDIKYKGKVIPRGSFITGLQILANETNLSMRQVRLALDKLKMTNEITTETTNKGTHIFVVNYAKFQDIQELMTNEMTSNMTNKCQTNDKQHDKQMTTSKEYKEIKNINNSSSSSSSNYYIENEEENDNDNYLNTDLYDSIKNYFEKNNYKSSYELFYKYNIAKNNNLTKDNYKKFADLWEAREKEKKSNNQNNLKNYDYLDDYIKDIIS